MGGPTVPNTIHFVFFGAERFSFFHYLAVRAAYEVNAPDAIVLHTDGEPTANPHWRAARELADVAFRRPRTEIAGHSITNVVYQSDLARLEILLERGGIYLDTDVLCLNPFGALRGHPCVLGRERPGGPSLSNAVIRSSSGYQSRRTSAAMLTASIAWPTR